MAHPVRSLGLRGATSASLLSLALVVAGCDFDLRPSLAPDTGPGLDDGGGLGDGGAGRDGGGSPGPDGGTPDGGALPCGGSMCTPGQFCDGATCVDRTCEDCDATQLCVPAPVGPGVICEDNTCDDDVDCPEARFCSAMGICEEDTCTAGERACTTVGTVEECAANGSGTFTRFNCFVSNDGFDGTCREAGGELFCGCRDDWDCPADTECVVDRCVGTGRAPTCQLPPADIADVLPSPEPGFPWGGEEGARDADDSPFPESSQVVVTPIVINLDDDNDDGLIDERDIPEIVFMTFCDSISGSARYQQHGVLRAVHGGGPERGEDYFATCDDKHWREGDALDSLSCTCTEGDLDPTSTLAAGDLDGDGVPEIVVAGEGNALRIFDNTGAPLVESSSVLAGDNQSLVIANLDGRGNAEVVSGRRAFQVLRDPMDGSWSFGDSWLGTPAESTGRNGQGPISCVADLDGDGLADVVAGTTVYRFPANEAGYARQSECDGSETGDQRAWCLGQMPVLWNANDVNTEVSIREDGFCGVADVWGATDGMRPGPDNPLDAQPEVVVVNNGRLQVFRGGTGEVLLDESLGGNNGGAPNIDDFDGDGFPEIGTAFSSEYVAFDLQVPTAACPAWTTRFGNPETIDNAAPYDLEGNPARTPPAVTCSDAIDCGDLSQFTCTPDGQCVCLHNGWERRTEDGSSRVTGSSVFDFNGDGAAEVIYNDECYFRIYRGLDGRVIFREPSESRTRTENPVVADVDSDGNAEIVFAASNESGFCGALFEPDLSAGTFPFNNGLEVWGDSSDTWVSARRIYNQHAYQVTNVYEGGGIPERQIGNWEIFGGRLYNTFRSQPRNPFGIAPDLQVAAVQISSPDAACGELSGEVDITVRVVNAGDLRVGADVPVALVGTWSDPALTEPLRDATGAPLRVTLGTALEARGVRFLSLRYDPMDNGREDLPDTVEVTVDPDMAERECREDNNSLTAPVEGSDSIADLRVEIGTVAGPCPSKTFELTVFNEGATAASNVLVRLYAGDPNAGGTPFHDELIAGPIAAGGMATVTASTLFPDVNARVFAVVDPLGTVEECNDGNNTFATTDFVDCGTILF